MPSGIRKHLKQLPYFLLYNYPAKLRAYNKICEKNKIRDTKLPLNAYHSPSPMNELCDYICTWEKKHLVWRCGITETFNSKELVLNHNIELKSDKQIYRKCRRIINDYAYEMKQHLNDEDTNSSALKAIVENFKKELQDFINEDEEIVANYVIDTSYNSISISKSFVWNAYGEYMLKNIRDNTDQRYLKIKEVDYVTSKEYLGKYYLMDELNNDVVE